VEDSAEPWLDGAHRHDLCVVRRWSDVIGNQRGI
jgi:hypothetical protein